MSSFGGQYLPLRTKNTTLAFSRGSVQSGIQKLLARQARLRTSSMCRGKKCQSVTRPLQSVAPLFEPKTDRIAPSGPLSVVRPVSPHQACVDFL
jgi:hypothetical protein